MIFISKCCHAEAEDMGAEYQCFECGLACSIVEPETEPNDQDPL